MTGEQKQRQWELECQRIDERNKEALKRIDEHEKLKANSRAYQPGGEFYRGGGDPIQIDEGFSRSAPKS